MGNYIFVANMTLAHMHCVPIGKSAFSLAVKIEISLPLGTRLHGKESPGTFKMSLNCRNSQLSGVKLRKSLISEGSYSAYK